jgi:hypothetical protein
LGICKSRVLFSVIASGELFPCDFGRLGRKKEIKRDPFLGCPVFVMSVHDFFGYDLSRIHGGAFSCVWKRSAIG